MAHDVDSNRRWGLFNFPPEEGDALRALAGPEISFDGLECNPPGRIEWWPVLLRQRLDGERIKATGLRGYAARRAISSPSTGRRGGLLLEQGQGIAILSLIRIATRSRIGPPIQRTIRG